MRLAVAVYLVLAQVCLNSCRIQHPAFTNTIPDRFFNYPQNLAKYIPILDGRDTPDVKPKNIKKLIPVYDDFDAWGADKKHGVDIMPLREKSKAVAYILARTGQNRNYPDDPNNVFSEEFKNGDTDHVGSNIFTYIGKGKLKHQSQDFQVLRDAEAVSTNQGMERDIPVDGIGKRWHYSRLFNDNPKPPKDENTTAGKERYFKLHETRNDKENVQNTEASRRRHEINRKYFKEPENISNEDKINKSIFANIVDHPLIEIHFLNSTENTPEDSKGGDISDDNNIGSKYVDSLDVSDIDADPQDLTLEESDIDSSSDSNSDVLDSDDLNTDENYSKTGDLIDSDENLDDDNKDIPIFTSTSIDSSDASFEVSESRESSDDISLPVAHKYYEVNDNTSNDKEEDHITDYNNYSSEKFIDNSNSNGNDNMDSSEYVDNSKELDNNIADSMQNENTNLFDNESGLYDNDNFYVPDKDFKLGNVNPLTDSNVISDTRNSTSKSTFPVNSGLSFNGISLSDNDSFPTFGNRDNVDDSRTSNEEPRVRIHQKLVTPLRHGSHRMYKLTFIFNR